MTDKDFEGRSAPDLLAQVSEHGNERELRTVRPGWWIQAYDGDEAAWLKVYYTAWGTHVPSQQKMTRVLARDSSGETSEIFELSSNLVRCCTKAEAKKAGLS